LVFEREFFMRWLFVALALSLSALPALAIDTTPLAPVPPESPFTHRYQTQQFRLQEAETKTRLMGVMQNQDKSKTANMELYDVTFYDLTMDLNPISRYLLGTTVVVAEVLANTLETVDLDLRGNMLVSGATAGGAPAVFSQFNDFLTITLDRPYSQGEFFTVSVDYSGNPASDYFGWSTYAGQPLIWTLSEPYGARRWWPCKDLNTDKADSVDLHITVPENLIVASNGLLESVTASSPGKMTFFWKERYPIPTYLVSLTIHPFATFSNTYTALDGTTTMPVDYYVLPNYLSQAQAAYPVTVDMLEAFAQGFGEYPFIDEKYGHAHFPWGGGMEHQTLTSLAYDAYSEHIISHELGHQWFGDMITCADFHHIWLNEGFATWTEAYWREIQYGPAAYRDEMDQAAYFGDGTIYVENPDNFWEIFDYYTTYQKASWIPHMLRGMLGDTTFFAALQDYRQAFEYDSATTEQFRDVFEGTSGLDLDQFFQQWIYGDGHPQYLVNWTTEAAAGGTRVQVRIEQLQSEPVFHMPLQVLVQSPLGDQVFTVENDQRVQWFTLEANEQFSGLQLDPDGWVLCQINYGGTSDLPGLAAGAPRLLPNVPNPFNPSTTIRYELPLDSDVQVAVYDLSGRLVRVLEEGRQPAGEHSVRWDGRSSQGQAQASGLYFVRLNAGGKTGIRKITLVQ
jgi:aminopeptidase N